MGVVYKARQVNLNRIVALKMILAGQLASEQDVKRFYMEAEAAACLNHPGIVPIFEVGKHEDQHFFSMTFVEGDSLAKRVADGPLAPREAASFVKKISEAVQYAHSRGVVHRDLKLANVLLNTDEEPLVTDFGLAKRSSTEQELTTTGQILGTPGYMPPEQAAGAAEKIGPPADIYSLGAILYCLLTGRPPFQAANVLDTLMQVMEQEPVAPRQLNPAVPRDLETICLKCLQKDMLKRYESAQALADDLDRWLRGEPILARPIGPVERGVKWVRRHPVVAGLIAAVVFAMVSGTAVSSIFAVKAHNRAIAEKEQRTRAEEQREIANQQRLLAEEQKRAANAAQQAEAQQRREATTAQQLAEQQRGLAEKREREAQWNLYLARLYSIAPHWERQEFGRLETLLNQYSPRKNEPDFRGWEWHYLRSQSEQHTSRLETGGLVTYLTWSPDGQRLAARRVADSAILIWHADSACLEWTLTGNGNLPLAWSPDGKQLAAGMAADQLSIWNVGTVLLPQRISRARSISDFCRKGAEPRSTPSAMPSKPRSDAAVCAYMISQTRFAPLRLLRSEAIRWATVASGQPLESEYFLGGGKLAIGTGTKR